MDYNRVAQELEDLDRQAGVSSDGSIEIRQSAAGILLAARPTQGALFTRDGNSVGILDWWKWQVPTGIEVQSGAINSDDAFAFWGYGFDVHARNLFSVSHSGVQMMADLPTNDSKWEKWADYKAYGACACAGTYVYFDYWDTGSTPHQSKLFWRLSETGDYVSQCNGPHTSFATNPPHPRLSIDHKRRYLYWTWYYYTGTYPYRVWHCFATYRIEGDGSLTLLDHQDIDTSGDITILYPKQTYSSRGVVRYYATSGVQRLRLFPDPLNWASYITLDDNGDDIGGIAADDHYVYWYDPYFLDPTVYHTRLSNGIYIGAVPNVLVKWTTLGRYGTDNIMFGHA